MMAPLRNGDLFPPPYVAPLGGPRQGPPGRKARRRADGTPSSVPLEELDGALVLESGLACRERSQIPSPARARILLPRIQTILSGWQLPDHRVSPLGRRQDAPVSSLRSILPCDHSPKPASALMCPARSSTTKRLPQDRAKSAARASGENGSSLLATTMLGNGKRTRGTGLKSRTSSGVWAGESTSAGATSRAPFTPSSDRVTQWATSEHARLWATRTGGPSHSATWRASVSSQSSSLGSIQSRWMTRRQAGSSACHRLCQCSGPE